MENEITLIVGALGTGKTTLASYATKQYEKVIALSTFGKDFTECEIVNNFEQAIEDRIYKICFVNDDIIENEIAIRTAYELGRRLLVIDEAHLYQDSESFKKVMRYSRHKELDVVLVSHTLFDFARLNRVLVNNIILFKFTDEQGAGEPYELSFIDRINPNNKVRELKQHEFTIVQGNIPTWLDKKDLLFKEKILMLKKESIG